MFPESKEKYKMIMLWPKNNHRCNTNIRSKDFLLNLIFDFPDKMIHVTPKYLMYFAYFIIGICNLSVLKRGRIPFRYLTYILYVYCMLSFSYNYEVEYFLNT